MRYLLTDDDGVTQFGSYFEHLRRIEKRLPETVFRFATDESRYPLNGPRTLHDARLRSIELRGESPRDFDPKEAVVTLLNAVGDRRFSLVYTGVTHVMASGEVWPDLGTADLLTHEVGREDDRVFHDLNFVDNFTLSIYCETFAFHETALATSV